MPERFVQQPTIERVMMAVCAKHLPIWGSAQRDVGKGLMLVASFLTKWRYHIAVLMLVIGLIAEAVWIALISVLFVGVFIDF
jgi:hypothetical protein